MVYDNNHMVKATKKEIHTYRKLSQAERRSIFLEIITLANTKSLPEWTTKLTYTAYEDWYLGRLRIANAHGIHRNHINAIIREISGEPVSTRKPFQCPVSDPYPSWYPDY